MNRIVDYYVQYVPITDLKCKSVPRDFVGKNLRNLYSHYQKIHTNDDIGPSTSQRVEDIFLDDNIEVENSDLGLQSNSDASQNSPFGMIGTHY